MMDVTSLVPSFSVLSSQFRYSIPDVLYDAARFGLRSESLNLTENLKTENWELGTENF